MPRPMAVTMACVLLTLLGQACGSRSSISDPYLLEPVTEAQFSGEMCSAGRTYEIGEGYGIRKGLAVQRDAYYVERCPAYDPMPEQPIEEEVEGGSSYLTTPNVRLYRKNHWKPFHKKKEGMMGQ